jgi:hypothetical protein
MTEADQVKANIENIKNEIGHLLLVKETLIRLIEITQKIFESAIVLPKVTSNLRMIGNKDIEVDLTPVKNASKEQLIARLDFYHYNLELAGITTEIEVKTNLIKEYEEHLSQYFKKQSQKVTDEMIFDKLKEAQDLKDMSEQEKQTLKGISSELLKRLNAGHDARLEVYESLSNLILQHG